MRHYVGTHLSGGFRVELTKNSAHLRSKVYCAQFSTSVLRPNTVTSYIVRTQRLVLRCFRVGRCHYEHTTRVWGQLRLSSEPLWKTEGYLRSTCWLCCMLSPVLLGYVFPDPDVRFTTNWTTVMVTARTYISRGIRLTIRRRVLELKQGRK